MADSASEERPTASIGESMTVILDDGKPLIVSQSADPHTDRKVRIEMKATFLKVAASEAAWGRSSRTSR